MIIKLQKHWTLTIRKIMNFFLKQIVSVRN